MKNRDKEVLTVNISDTARVQAALELSKTVRILAEVIAGSAAHVDVRNCEFRGGGININREAKGR